MTVAGRIVFASLPEVLAALMADTVTGFPALRPHQKHAWHAFLVQIGHLAMVRAGLSTPPDTAQAWREALMTLTPDDPDGAAWALVASPDRPALLQPPIPGGDLETLTRTYETPDLIDMLVTSRNHDVKSSVMRHAQPDDWLFALLTLQTCGGYDGRTLYGISRINGGYGNRPGIGIKPPGGPGAHVRRDLRILARRRDEILKTYSHYDPQGITLLWLQPWDGTTSVSPAALDPLCVEVCRRLRLVRTPDGTGLMARGVGTQKPRVASHEDQRGVTGDPWTPLDTDAKGAKALTVDGRGFHYARAARILTGGDVQAAMLQEIDPEDPPTGLVLSCRALARGEGKTEGWHERTIPLSATVVRLFRARDTDPLAALARLRVEQVGILRGKVLRGALMVLFQQGPDDMDWNDPASARHADPVLAAFDATVDRDFFRDLWAEVDCLSDAEAAKHERSAWLLRLRTLALDHLETAQATTPRSSVRAHRARARAQRALFGSFKHHFGSFVVDDAPHDRIDDEDDTKPQANTPKRAEAEELSPS